MRGVGQAVLFSLLLFIKGSAAAQKGRIVVPVWVTDTIYQLPEVIRQGAYIDSVSHHKRHFTILAFQENSNRVHYWQAEVCEDNGTVCVPFFHFYCWSRTREIKYYDAESGKVMSLAAWRKLKASWHER